MYRHLVACFLFFGLPGANAQLIRNPDFETGDSSGWRFTNPASFGRSKEPGYVFSIDKDASGDHGYVARLSSTGNSVWAQISQRIPYKATDSIEKFRLTASIKLSGVNSGEAGLSARLLRGKQSIGYFQQSLSGDTGWTTISTGFLLNSRVDTVAIFCSIKGTGQVSFDNVRLQKDSNARIWQSPEAGVYLDTAINIITRTALYRDSVDFDGLVAYARLLAADAKTPADCYGAIEYLLGGLQDHHSHFWTAAQSTYLKRTSDTLMSMPTGRKIAADIGYVKVPACVGINATLEKFFADSLRNIIRQADHAGIAGWIIDVRDNTGGNSFPMLLGLGPVLGEGVFRRTTRNGITTDSTGYWSGNIRNKDSVLERSASTYNLKEPFPKVAILLNNLTASSGESVVLSFKGRPRAMLFGEPSYGLTTANADFTLSDGAVMLVCSEKQTDRFGNEYGGKILPDVSVSDRKDTEADEVVDAAVKWLRQK